MSRRRVLGGLSCATIVFAVALLPACMYSVIRQQQAAQTAAKRDCHHGIATACRKAAATQVNTHSLPKEEQRDLLVTGCVLGDAEACNQASSAPFEFDPSLEQRACALGNAKGCGAVAGWVDGDPRIREVARQRMCTLDPKRCFDVAEYKATGEPILAIRMAKLSCTLDTSLCADADELIARARLPFACARAEPGWKRCIVNDQHLPEACRAGIEEACERYGSQLSRRDLGKGSGRYGSTWIRLR